MQVDLMAILYILCSILVITLIILTIKLIFSLRRIDKLVDDVQDKMDSFDNMFSLLDKTTDLLSGFSDRLVESISELLKRVFKKRKCKEVEDEEEE